MNDLLFKHGIRIISIVEDTGMAYNADGDIENVEGYQYTIYESQEEYNNGNDVDGGFCTGTLSDAIEMAINK